MRLFEDKEPIRRLAILALVLSLAAACNRSGEGTKPPPPPPQAHDWIITVGPDPCQLTANGQPAPTQRLKRGKNFIVWKHDTGQSLTIRLHVPEGCVLPFPAQFWTAVGPGIYELTAVNGACFSGVAVPTACPREYKYDQILDGHTCDGQIIIEP